MSFARVLTVASACVALGAAAAACSGSFGSGTGLPQTMGTPSFGAASPTPPPTSSSVILTYGESTAFQPLPEIAGYSGALAFPKAPEPTAAPAKGEKSRKDTPAPAPTPVAIAIGATLSIVKPADGPDLNFESGKGKRKRTREHPARAIAYVTLLPTHDATLDTFPRISLDIPREVAAQYRDGEFGLALWNSGAKDTAYRLAVAEPDTSATPPPSSRVAAAASAKPGAAPGASGAPAATPTPTPAPARSPGASAAPTTSPTLPPARLLFAATATPFKLVANRPAVFAIYALPHPTAAHAAAAAAATSASAHPAASGVPAAPAAVASAVPASPVAATAAPSPRP